MLLQQLWRQWWQKEHPVSEDRGLPSQWLTGEKGQLHALLMLSLSQPALCVKPGLFHPIPPHPFTGTLAWPLNKMLSRKAIFFFFGWISFLWAEWIEHSLCGEIREERRGWSAWWGQRATMAGAQLHWVTAAERSMNFVKAVTKERPKERKKKFTFAWFFCTQANKILFAFLVHRQYYT